MQAGPATGRLDTGPAYSYGRLLQAYEAMFWSSLS